MTNQLKSFKDLDVWQKAADLAVVVYEATEQFPRAELYGITSQMRRAVVSITSNLAEGFKRTHKKEKLQFYGFAYGSAAELESQMEISYKLGFLHRKNYDTAMSLVVEISKMIDGLIKSLNSKSYSLNPRRGFTLVEIIVAVGLFSVVIGVVVGGFVQALRTQRQAAAIVAANDNIFLVLEQMAREMRIGHLFCASRSDGRGTAGVFSCQTGGIAFIDGITNDTIEYRLSASASAIERGVNGAFSPVTGENVLVRYLLFSISGNQPEGPVSGDRRQPRITISVGVSPRGGAIERNTIRLQTTVSSRAQDI